MPCLKMNKILVKKYYLRKASKWLKRMLIPKSIQVYDIVRKWKQDDKRDWSAVANQNDVSLNRYEYNFLSQNGEDGIIKYLFSEIGFKSRYFVEFGFGAKQSNSLRLMLKEDFNGLFLDGSQEQCSYFNQASEKMGISGVKAVCAFLTVENIDALLKENHVPYAVDFLSIDVDGNDYWLWQKITSIDPRVVCIEYNSGIGYEQSWTIPYNPDFERFEAHPSGFFAGASLKALASLGKNKGYRLVGCDNTGTNAFFLRNDLGMPAIPTLGAREAFKPHLNWLGRGFSEVEQYEIMASMPYEEV